MAIAQDWWDRWWGEDWSWEGLAERPWHGWVVPVDASGEDDGEPLPRDTVDKALKTRRATLQDYWKRAQREAGLSDADFLIRVEHKGWVELEVWRKHAGSMHFTLMHLPLRWRNGAETLKSDPNKPPEALITLLKTELNRAIQETIFEYGRRLKGPDHRMQWSGGVLPKFDLPELRGQIRSEYGRIPISIAAANAVFSGDADFRNTDFSSAATFINVAFNGTTNFESTTFSGNVDFRRASFSGATTLRSAVFSGDAFFTNAVFSSTATFMSAAFSGSTTFMSTTFSNYASFIGVAFANDVDFIKATFSGSADFISVTFSRAANFISTSFSSGAFFTNAVFSSYAYFNSTAFSGNVNFSGAIFLSDAVFSGQGNSVRSDAVKAVIRPESGEAGLQIYEQAEDVMWTARRSFPNADFSQALFLERAYFDHRDFHSQTSFGGAVFLREAAFHSAELHRGMHFRDTSFAFALERGRSPLRVRLRARKGGWRDLRHGLLDWFTSTSRPIRLEWSQVKTIIRARRRAYEAFRQAFGEDVPRWRYWKVFFAQFLENREARFQRQPQHEKNRYYAGVEDCFRTLKHKMEDRRDRGQEARFFKMELLARRERRRDPHVPWWEGPMSWIYRATSDFGTSFAQPLIVLFLMVVPLFALLYWCMILLPYGFFFGEGESPSAATWGEALSFSLGRVFPFGPWGDPEACSAIGQMLSPLSEGEACTQPRAFGPGTPIGLRVLASFQSLTALVLVFLSGLAIRRRFQIN